MLHVLSRHTDVQERKRDGGVLELTLSRRLEG